MWSKYKYYFAGVGAACAVYGLYYLSQEVENTLNKPIPKDQLLTLLKSLEKDLIPYLVTLASFSQSVQTRVGKNNLIKISDILEHHCPVVTEIRRVEREVCSKYSTTPDDLQIMCTKVFKEDPDIQKVYQALKTVIESAYKGVFPEFSQEVPEQITPELTLTIIKDLYDATVYSTYTKTSEILSSGEKFSVDSPKYQEFSAEMHKMTEKFKEKVLSKYGLDRFPLPGRTILHQALQLYKSFPDFVAALTELEADFEQALMMITTAKFPESEARKLGEKFEDRVIWELDEPREVVEKEVFEVINH